MGLIGVLLLLTGVAAILLGVTGIGVNLWLWQWQGVGLSTLMLLAGLAAATIAVNTLE